MHGGARLIIVGLSITAAGLLAACGGSTATPLPSLPPDTPSPDASAIVETLPPLETVAPADSAEPEETAAPKKTTYTVKKGDTLWGIAEVYAAKNDVTTQQMIKLIKKANPKIKADNILHTGWKLVIPAP